jgi:hypothetical protein
MKYIKTKLLAFSMILATATPANAGSSISISHTIGNNTNISFSYNDVDPFIAYEPVYRDIYGRKVVYVNATPTTIIKPILVDYTPAYYPVAIHRYNTKQFDKHNNNRKNHANKHHHKHKGGYASR